MSLVSHDATSIRHHGPTHGENLDEEKTNNVPEGDSDNFPAKLKTADKELSKTINYKIIDENLQTGTLEEKTTDYIQGQITDKTSKKDRTAEKELSKRNSRNKIKVSIGGKSKCENVNYVPEKRKSNEIIFKKKSPVKGHWKKRLAKRTIETKNRNKKYFSNTNLKADKTVVVKHAAKKKKCERRNDEIFPRMKNAGNKIVQRSIEKSKRPTWSFNSGVLILLVTLNVTGLSSAVDTTGFSSTLTSRMIATFLGYPTTCSLGAEVRPCTLTLTCWLRGGTRLRGCGGWLFSCCGPPEPSRDGFDNSIPSSDWKYKMSPPKLRQVPQRNVLPNNVFRRRVDDAVSQMDCGLPSSRILQKRIIGGREARFAEFPWQAHVRISEFQCGGVLVSRWFVATAAHCVSRAHTRDIAVWLGAIDTSATHHPARKIGVVQKILHPLFQFRMTQPDRYDIALLKLSRPITYMSHILPICLPDYDMELRGRSGVIAGWGKTDASNSHTGTNLLRSATVPILSKEQCINWHQSKQISVEIHSEMICAGHSDGHQDACLGDSGGPLIVFDNGRYVLVGITSAGFGCGVDHQPGIYHNVKVTANWIRGVIAPSINYIDV